MPRSKPRTLTTFKYPVTVRVQEPKFEALDTRHLDVKALEKAAKAEIGLVMSTPVVIASWYAQ